jgi:hypothetical protein
METVSRSRFDGDEGRDLGVGVEMRCHDAHCVLNTTPLGNAEQALRVHANALRPLGANAADALRGVDEHAIEIKQDHAGPNGS